MKKPTNILTVFFLSARICVAQNQHNIDSLQNELNKFESYKKELGANLPKMADTVKANLLYRISIEYLRNDPEKAMDYSRQTLSLSERLNFMKGIANAWNSMGNIYNDKGEYPQALEYFNKSLKIRSKIKDKKGVASSYNNIGLTYYNQGNYAEALKNHLVALKIREDLDIKKDIAASYNNLGLIYDIQGNDDEALKNHLEALKIREATGDKQGVASSYSNIGNIYANQKNSSEAIKNFIKALKIREEIGDKQGVATCYSNMGVVYADLSDYDKTLKNHFEALRIREEIGDKNGIAISENNIGFTYLKLNNLPDALQHALKGLSIAKKIGALNVMKDSYQRLAEIYSKMDNYKEAYANETLYKEINDSLFNSENQNKFTQLQMQFEFDKKQAEQKAEQDKKDAVQESALQRQKIIKNVELVGLAMVVILAFVLNKRYREKRKANIILEATLKDLKSTQAQLVQSEKMASLGQLTAGIAHEIKNPLNFVTNFSQLSTELVNDFMIAKSDQERMEIGSNLKRNLEKINVHGQRADSIVKNMLEHSRIGTREKELTDINYLCDEAVNLAYYSMKAKIPDFNCSIEKMYSKDLLVTKIISQDISRVILNLLNNAFYSVAEKQNKYPDLKPTIFLFTLMHDKLIEIKVKDNGIGFNQEIKNKIFQPFFTTKPAGQGTGLGLSLCYDIIKSHGGEFRAESEEGEYAEFIITLPA